MTARLACKNRGKLLRISNTSYWIYDKHILGNGSYSVVYGGINTKNNEKIAIKKISIENIDEVTKKLIENEIDMVRVLKKKNHMNIVRYYDVIITPFIIYIVMEYCEQGTLASILIGPLKEKIIKYYFKQMIDGIRFLHSIGYVHQDIKPQNIMLTDNYRIIKIGDFGFCEKIKNIKYDLYRGSLLYMAPELIFTKKYDHRVDIWSAGIILYEMFYGVHPFSLKHDDIESVKFLMSRENPLIRPKYSKDSPIDDNSMEILKKILTCQENRISGIDLIESEWLCVENDGLPREEITLYNLFYSNSDHMVPRSLPTYGLQKVKLMDNHMSSKSQIIKIPLDKSCSRIFTGEFRDAINKWKTMSPISTTITATAPII